MANNDLAQLAQLVQLYGAVSRPQQDQQQINQEGQYRTQDLALMAKAESDRQAEAQASLAQSGTNAANDLATKNAQLAALKQQHDDEMAQRATEMANTVSDSQMRTKASFVSDLINRGATMDQIYPMIKDDAVLGPLATAQHAAVTDQQAKLLAPQIQALYGSLSAGKIDPTSFHSALATLGASNPDAFAKAVPWNQLNDSLTSPATSDSVDSNTNTPTNYTFGGDQDKQSVSSFFHGIGSLLSGLSTTN